ALASGLPQYLQEVRGWSAVDSYKPLFGLTVIFSFALLFVYRGIGEEIQQRRTERKLSRSTGVFVSKMAALAVVDNFGAGLAGALVPYWFLLRIGVVRTMAFSHGLASMIYLALPLAATLNLAAALLVIRSFFAYMDNPLRASFTMAMVKSNERGSAAGVTSLARIVPFGISPTISTYLMQTVSLTLPLFLG